MKACSSLGGPSQVAPTSTTASPSRTGGTSPASWPATPPPPRTAAARTRRAPAWRRGAAGSGPGCPRWKRSRPASRAGWAGTREGPCGAGSGTPWGRNDSSRGDLRLAGTYTEGAGARWQIYLLSVMEAITAPDWPVTVRNFVFCESPKRIEYGSRLWANSTASHSGAERHHRGSLCSLCIVQIKMH